MASSEFEKPRSVAEAIDAIEATYELMLAYAAQGREREEDDPMGIRQALRRASLALDVLDAATPRDLGSPGGAVEQATGDMLAVLKQDVVKARAAFRFVLAQRSIGSQMIDNINASIHVRALLTDLFLIDEALKSSDMP
ncbi:MAG: hypothetical protein EXR27_22165 [Betaproteobacteria bacterium]|nr:hypothetical protein [Pseudolabrys sp.]MSQ73947.1 hypothetical protein [Betaproteobacteria bacterium]